MKIHSIIDNERDCYISLDELIIYLSIVDLKKEESAENFRKYLIDELYKYRKIFIEEMKKR